MKTTYLPLPENEGGGNSYSAPEITVIAVPAERGFADSVENYELNSMEVKPEEEW